jgi:hypothetical protein
VIDSRHLNFFKYSGRSPDPCDASAICKADFNARPPRHSSPTTINVHTPAARGKYGYNTAVSRRYIVFTTTRASALNQYQGRNYLIDRLIGAIQENQRSSWRRILARPTRDTLSLSPSLTALGLLECLGAEPVVSLPIPLALLVVTAAVGYSKPNSPASQEHGGEGEDRSPGGDVQAKKHRAHPSQAEPGWQSWSILAFGTKRPTP